MPRALIAVAVFVFATAVSADRHGRPYAELMPGIWSTEIWGDGFYVYGEVQYLSNGKTIGRGLRVVHGNTERIEFSGRWQIEDDVLVSSTEGSTDPGWFPFPRTYRDRIELLTRHKMVLQAESGERSTRYRLEYSRLFPR